MFPLIRKLTLSLSIAALAVGAAAATSPPPDPADSAVAPADRLGALIERMRWENERLESLEAEFTQRKESELLLEVEESEGVFSYAAPDRVRWEYHFPNPISLLIDGDRMTTWYRDLDRAEEMAIGRQSQQVLRYLGASSSMERLLEYFDVALHMPTDESRPHRLELTPRFARVAKRVRSMNLWVEREHYLLVRLNFVEADGDETDFQFSNFKLNPELPSERFVLDLPENVDLRVLSADAGAR